MKGILVCKLIQDIKLLRMTFSIWRIYYAQYLYGTRLVLYYIQLLRTKNDANICNYEFQIIDLYDMLNEMVLISRHFPSPQYRLTGKCSKPLFKL